MHEQARLIRRVLSDIRTQRDSGRVFVALDDRNDYDAPDRRQAPQRLADQVAQRVGCRGLGQEWVILNERGARATLYRCLVTDLAYDAEIMPPEQALALVDRFFAFFDAHTWYGTNGRFVDPRYSAEMLLMHSPTTLSRTWADITDATFDMGIVAVGRRHVGIVWVADED